MNNHKIRVDALRIDWRDDELGVSCQAVATVSYQIAGSSDRRLESLRSGGLCEIDEEPSSHTFRREIENDELTDLLEHLATFGIVVDPEDWDQLIASARKRAKLVYGAAS